MPKLSELTDLTTPPVLTDEVPLLVDPGGTPVNRSCPLDLLLGSMVHFGGLYRFSSTTQAVTVGSPTVLDWSSQLAYESPELGYPIGEAGNERLSVLRTGSYMVCFQAAVKSSATATLTFRGRTSVPANVPGALTYVYADSASRIYTPTWFTFAKYIIGPTIPDDLLYLTVEVETDVDCTLTFLSGSFYLVRIGRYVT
ncbi:MAG: hypothetical protein IPH13_20595 [Planctomycetes bacterium]|nr:hypothetical protein [Planctomycetota bacterium]